MDEYGFGEKEEKFIDMSKTQINLMITVVSIVTSMSWWFTSGQDIVANNLGETIGITGSESTPGEVVLPETTHYSYPAWTLSDIPNPSFLIDPCLSNPGPLITLAGEFSTYKNKELAENSKIDASGAFFINGGDHPVTIGGENGVCWFSGKIFGGYPLDASWETTHSTAGIQIQDGTFLPVIEGLYIDQIGDGIKVRLGENSGQTGIADPFTVRGVWLRDIRDDCIESDWQAGGIIEDSLLDGCYVLFATEKRPGVVTNGSENTWEIRDTLAYLHDQIGVYDGESPGHGRLFKWDETSPKWKMYNSILRIDSDVSESSNQFNFQMDKLEDCQNNILVWLGSGPFPGTVPSCFSITKDKSVWDDAVREWKISHEYTSPIRNFRSFTPLLMNGGFE